MNLLLNIVGCLIISAIVAIIVSICFMFLFFNLIYVIRKLVLATTFPPSTLNQSSTHMTNRKHEHKKVNYHEYVIYPFLNLIFRNHASSIVQKCEDNQKSCYANCYQKGIDGITPEIVDNPLNNEVAIHGDNLAQENKHVNHKQTEP